MNYIGTYFYHDISDIDSFYPSANCDIEKRNLVYWRTIYCCLKSAKIVNKDAGLMWSEKTGLVKNLEKTEITHRNETRTQKIHERL